jgi:hypothetical protein
MEKHNSKRTEFSNKILCKLSSFGFATYCDYVICSRFDGNPHGTNPNIDIDCLKALRQGDRLFFNAYSSYHFNNHIIDILCEILKETNIKINIYILFEPVLPWKFVEKLLPICENIFLMNNEYEHPNVHHMPIGIRDGEEVFSMHRNFSQKSLIYEKTFTREKKYLCLMCFTKETHQERIRCENMLSNQSFVLNLNNQQFKSNQNRLCGSVPLEINYEKTHESIYILAPRGAGIDTHRFYEAIYLDAIPIVKRTHTPFDKLYNIFPCLVVEDWNDITEDFLLNKKDEMIHQLETFKKTYPNWMTDLDSTQDLLKNT